MSVLEWVLWIKIVVTVILWAGPLLFFPGFAFSRLGVPSPPMLFIRLLGAAYAALVVGYWFGAMALAQGDFPLGVVWMALISNGLATLVLFAHALAGTWREWGAWARAYMWISLCTTATLAVLIAIFGAWVG